MSANDGGPAFSEVPADCNGYEGRPGMTLRDYFAAEALPEAIARELGPLGTYQHFCEESAAIMACAAYMVADAMLHERERQA